MDQMENGKNGTPIEGGYGGMIGFLKIAVIFINSSLSLAFMWTEYKKTKKYTPIDWFVLIFFICLLSLNSALISI